MSCRLAQLGLTSQQPSFAFKNDGEQKHKNSKSCIESVVHSFSAIMKRKAIGKLLLSTAICSIVSREMNITMPSSTISKHFRDRRLKSLTTSRTRIVRYQRPFNFLYLNEFSPFFILHLCERSELKLTKNIEINGEVISGETLFMNACINGHKNNVLKKP